MSRPSPILSGFLKLLAPDGHVEQCRFSGAYVEHPQFERTELKLESPTFGERRFVSGDLFWCLADLRKEIEPLGWRVLCNGARKDARPSGMCGSMGAGARLYVLKGERVTGKDLVRTFDEAPPHLVSTFDEQRQITCRLMGLDE